MEQQLKAQNTNWENLIVSSELLYSVYRVAQNVHISICLMLNGYSFVKSQPSFIFFGWEEDILNIACKLVNTILCDWRYLVVCQHNSWDSTENGQYYFYKVVWKRAISTVNSICTVLLGIYSGASLPKMIKFGWDFTKLYQFNIKQMERCSFLGHPVRRRFRKSKMITSKKTSIHFLWSGGRQRP